MHKSLKNISSVAVKLSLQGRPLQSFSNFFDLFVLLGENLFHVAVGCGLLELLLQFLNNNTETVRGEGGKKRIADCFWKHMNSVA